MIATVQHSISRLLANQENVDKFVPPLKTFKGCIQKLRETDEPTIQNALTFIMQLSRLTELNGAKCAHYNNFLAKTCQGRTLCLFCSSVSAEEKKVL